MKIINKILNITICIFCIIFSCSIAAKVYKHVDKNGNINYSDQQQEGSEEVHVAPLQRYTPSTSTTRLNNLPALPPLPNKKHGRYEYFELKQPDNNVHFSPGQQEVEVVGVVHPNLTNGDKVVLLLNGTIVQGPQSRTVFTLPPLERGEYIIQLQIVDKQNNLYEKYKTNEIKVFQHRPSVNFPNASP